MPPQVHVPARPFTRMPLLNKSPKGGAGSPVGLRSAPWVIKPSTPKPQASQLQAPKHPPTRPPSLPSARQGLILPEEPWSRRRRRRVTTDNMPYYYVMDFIADMFSRRLAVILSAVIFFSHTGANPCPRISVTSRHVRSFVLSRLTQRHS
ncbi:hypothetical protein B0I35DRAFT_129419 [Stachybotrys elegans]|uniref:Uncharacterized protein n=1 Tax=Stachybotrys elegans TaxID=80388 RepID=A0A8K0T1J4_9HYPO|nr:hypothetical protein B0I35DRAFT_129419 [Stachybotrys elegans]